MPHTLKPRFHRFLNGAPSVCLPQWVKCEGSGMYLRKTDGPRAVMLPDGKVMTRADLPPPDTQRWVASRKAAVVRAVQAGLIRRQTALETYRLSEDEFSAWEKAVSTYGEAALRATALKRYRQP